MTKAMKRKRIRPNKPEANNNNNKNKNFDMDRFPLIKYKKAAETDIQNYMEMRMLRIQSKLAGQNSL